MQMQTAATRETAREMQLLENRIKMLQKQEARMKQQNEQQEQKIRQMAELRRKAEEHR